VGVATKATRVEADPTALKRRVWAVANLLRTSGFNTLETIDHVTLLLLFRLLAEPHAERAPGVEPLRESLGGVDLLAECLRSSSPARHFSETAYPRLVETIEQGAAGHALDAIVDGFELRLDDDELFRRLLELLADMPIDAPDVNGMVYEHLIARLSEAGHLGQYFTPRHIVDLMVSILSPQPGETIYDPACGTGGFLIGAAAREVLNGSDPNLLPLYGGEINRTVRRLCVMNLLIRGLDPSGVRGGDSLRTSGLDGGFDVVLSNPPFGGSVDSGTRTEQFPIPTKASEGLFLQHVLAVLRPGGRAAVICPEGLLANGGSNRALRRHLMQEARVDAVISLPGGVFNPYTAVRTGILVFTKGKPTRRAWFFDVRRDGFELNARRHPSGESDLPQVEEGLRDRRQGELSAAVEREVIQRHGERLVASRFIHELKNGSTGSLVELGRVCVLRKVSVRPSESPDASFTYVAMEHIEPRSGRLLSVQPSLGSEIKSTKARFVAGDVLYGKLRPYLAKVLLAKFDGICSTELLVLRPDAESIRAEYLAEVLLSSHFVESAVALTVGANHPRIHPKDLLGIGIPVPSLAEQDVLMGRVATARSRIESMRVEIDDAEKAVQEAVDLAWR
jgi:type I restriction-modification system DNA methylase subunit